MINLNNTNAINNRIIQRIAAYYDTNGRINNNIQQPTSNENYNDNIDACHVLHSLLSSDLSDATNCLRYDSENNDINFDIGIGLCGDSFIAKNGKQVDVEWQVKAINPKSVDAAYEQLDIQQQNQQTKHTFNKAQHLQLCNEFESTTDEQYFLGILLVYINETFNKALSSDKHFFPKNTSKASLINYGQQLIQEVKQKLK